MFSQHGQHDIIRARKISEFHLACWASNSQVLLVRGTSPLAQGFKLINNSWTCFNHLTQMVFNSLNVHLHLVYNVAPRNHIEEKCKKFKTSRINKSPSHFSFDTGTVLNLKRPHEHIFSCQCAKNSFSWGKRSSFEIKTILSYFSGSLKVFWRLNYPFPLLIKLFFISRGTLSSAN